MASTTRKIIIEFAAVERVITVATMCNKDRMQPVRVVEIRHIEILDPDSIGAIRVQLEYRVVPIGGDRVDP